MVVVVGEGGLVAEDFCGGNRCDKQCMGTAIDGGIYGGGNIGIAAFC